MPELVGDVADDLGVVAPGDAAVDLDVGDVGQLRVFEAVRAPLQPPQPQVERAELPLEGDLLVLARRWPGNTSTA